MVPLDGLPLEQEGDDHREDGQGNHFLDDLELHQVEGASVSQEADPVGRDRQAVFEESDAPGEQDNEDEWPSGGDFHLLKLEVPIPGEGHEDVGKHQHQYRPKPFHKFFSCLVAANLVFLSDLKKSFYDTD